MVLQDCVVSIDEPMFQPFPSEIFFQNYEPFKRYEVPLVLRNSDKVVTVMFLFVIFISLKYADVSNVVTQTGLE